MEYQEHLKDVAINYDQLSEFEPHAWSHNTRYLPSLLKGINPYVGGIAVDVFCQRGDLARTLSKQFSKVIGLDVSPKMIEKAKERSQGYQNIVYDCADFLEYDIAENSCGLITMVACLHHFPMEEALAKAKRCLKRSGRLIVVDMYRPATLGDIALALVSGPLNTVGMKLFDHPKASAEEMAQWRIHATLDTYDTIPHVKEIAKDQLPGAVIHTKLFWRYTLVWVKP